MRFLILLVIMPITLLNAETIFYDSNNSGMILDQLAGSDVGKFYIKKDIDDAEFKHIFYFISDGITKTTTIEQYSKDYNELISISKLENDSETIENYANDLIDNVVTLKNNKIVDTEKYSYNGRGELSKVVLVDSYGDLIHTDSYYRDKDGALRIIKRISSEEVYSHWFYTNGAVKEYWLIENGTSTRTRYNNLGQVMDSTNYKDEILLSLQDYYYDSSDILIRTSKKTGKNRTDKIYNIAGFVKETNIYNNDILQMKVMYEYQEKLLTKEVKVGHGKLEENYYYRDSNDDINLITYYVNGELKKKEIIEDEDSEIWELYIDGKLYLKEYYYLGEKLQKELYLNDKLFKSEIFNE